MDRQTTEAGDRAGHEGLLERDVQLDAIEAALNTAAAGRGATLLIVGAAGLGKSRLLEAARGRAEAAGLAVVGARGGPLEAEYAFGVARQLVSSFAGRDEASVPAGLRSVLDPDHVPAVAPDAMAGALYGLTWACAELAADAPLLLEVDDAHWADRPTLRWLAFLARRLEDLPVALLIASRPPDAGDAPAELGELAADPAVTTHLLHPLTEAGTLALTRRRFGPAAEPSFARACHEWTGGNPLLLAELQAALVEEGVEPSSSSVAKVRAVPVEVGRVVLVRLARLSTDATELARAVAILGDDAQVPVAAALAGLEPGAAASAVEALVCAELLAPGAPLRFAHPILREAVYEDMPAAGRGLRHRQAAGLLSDHGRPADEIASQLMRAPPGADPWTVASLRATARHASASGGADAAIPLLERALLEPPPATERAAVLLELGQVEAAAGRPRAVERLASARDAASPGAARATAAMALGQTLLWSGRGADAADALRAARAELDGDEGELRLLVDATRLSLAAIVHDVGDDLEEVAAELALLPGATMTERVALASVARRWIAEGRTTAQAAGLARRALGDDGLALLPDPTVAVLLADVLVQADLLDEALIRADVLLDRAHTLGSPLWFAAASTFRAHLNTRLGRLADAEADARQVLEAEGAPQVILTAAHSVLARVLLDREGPAAAAAALERADADGTVEDSFVLAILLHAQGLIAFAERRPAAAVDAYRRSGELAELAGYRNPAVIPWCADGALALAALGRHAEARELVAPALERARAAGPPTAVAKALRAASLAAELVDVGGLRGAAAMLEPSPARRDRAKALLDLGAALRRARERSEAREPLAEAMELAHTCGADAVVARAREELLAAGARPRRIERTGVDALTASELRVARLAADGSSNPEIAGALFVSRKTVEGHMRAILRKLSIASRAELPGVLGDG